MESRNQNVDLSSFDQDFQNAPIEEKKYDDVPDGKYLVKVEKVELTTSKAKSIPMLKWTLKVLGPKYENRLIWRYNVLSSRENIGWLKNDLHTCNVKIERLSDLKNHLEKLLDLKIEITKRTKGENVNIYFNKLIDYEIEAQTDGTPKEDLPF